MVTIPHDKALHFIAGVLLFAVGHFISIPVGLFLAFAYAAGKEIYDLASGKGTPEWMDFVYTAAGGIVGYVCYLPPLAS